MSSKSHARIRTATERLMNSSNNDDSGSYSSDYIQWLQAMKMVARLPGGVPPEFRKKLWIALAERYLESIRVNWAREEEKCFSQKLRADKLETEIVKGFNMLGALILQVMDKNEFDSLKVMIFLIEGCLPTGYFCGSLSGLETDLAVFREILGVKLPQLSTHLHRLQGRAGNDTSLEPPLMNVFTIQWFLTLFCNCLPLTCVLRVWDLIFIEGSDILLRTALAIWSLLEIKVVITRTADHFYCVMAELSRELLNGNLTDSDGLIEKIVELGPIPGLHKLRRKYTKHIMPWKDQKAKLHYGQTNRNTILERKLYNPADEPDSDHDSQFYVTSRIGLKLSKPQTSTRTLNTSPEASRDRLGIDMTVLKRQYERIRDRQKQAHMVLTAAVSRQSISVNPSSREINQLLLGRTAIKTKNGHRKESPRGAIPPARLLGAHSPQKLCELEKIALSKHPASISSTNNQKKNMSEDNQDLNKLNFKKEFALNRKGSESSSYSEDSDANSSTSTSLCDDYSFDERRDSSPMQTKSSPHSPGRDISKNISNETDPFEFHEYCSNDLLGVERFNTQDLLNFPEYSIRKNCFALHLPDILTSCHKSEDCDIEHFTSSNNCNTGHYPTVASLRVREYSDNSNHSSPVSELIPGVDFIYTNPSFDTNSKISTDAHDDINVFDGDCSDGVTNEYFERVNLMLDDIDQTRCFVSDEKKLKKTWNSMSQYSNQYSEMQLGMDGLENYRVIRSSLNDINHVNTPTDFGKAKLDRVSLFEAFNENLVHANRNDPVTVTLPFQTLKSEGKTVDDHMMFSKFETSEKVSPNMGKEGRDKFLGNANEYKFHSINFGGPAEFTANSYLNFSYGEDVTRSNLKALECRDHSNCSMKVPHHMLVCEKEKKLEVDHKEIPDNFRNRGENLSVDVVSNQESITSKPLTNSASRNNTTVENNNVMDHAAQDVTLNMRFGKFAEKNLCKASSRKYFESSNMMEQPEEMHMANSGSTIIYIDHASAVSKKCRIDGDDYSSGQESSTNVKFSLIKSSSDTATLCKSSFEGQNLNESLNSTFLHDICMIIHDDKEEAVFVLPSGVKSFEGTDINSKEKLVASESIQSIEECDEHEMVKLSIISTQAFSDEIPYNLRNKSMFSIANIPDKFNSQLTSFVDSLETDATKRKCMAANGTDSSYWLETAFNCTHPVENLVLSQDASLIAKMSETSQPSFSFAADLVIQNRSESTNDEQGEETSILSKAPNWNIGSAYNESFYILSNQVDQRCAFSPMTKKSIRSHSCPPHFRFITSMCIDLSKRFYARTSYTKTGEIRSVSCPDIRSYYYDAHRTSSHFDRALKVIEENSSILHSISMKKPIIGIEHISSGSPKNCNSHSLSNLNQSVSISSLKDFASQYFRRSHDSNDNVAAHLASIKKTISSIDALCANQRTSNERYKFQAYFNSLHHAENFDGELETEENQEKKNSRLVNYIQIESENCSSEPYIPNAIIGGILYPSSHTGFGSLTISQIANDLSGDLPASEYNNEDRTEIHKPSSRCPLEDRRNRDIEPTKIGIRHTTVTSTMYDRYLSQKKSL